MPSNQKVYKEKCDCSYLVSFCPQPIYLRVMLQSDRGTIECCGALTPCSLCANATRLSTIRNPYLPRLPTDPDLTKDNHNTILTLSNPKLQDDSILKRTRTGSLNETLFRIPHVEITTADYSSFDGVFVNEIDSTLLTVKHFQDPYTPESIDSRSPNAEISSGSEDLGIEIIDRIEKTIIRDRSVSPTQLKNRLDKLLEKDREKPIPELQRLNSRESCKSEVSRKNGLCCLALKCYGFCRRKTRKVRCRCNRVSCCSN